MRPGSLLKLVAIGSLVLATLIFALFKTQNLLTGNKLTILAPTSGTTLSEAYVIIRGQTSDSSLLVVGGAKVIPARDGTFEQQMLLGLGYNRIEIRSVDRFNRESKELLELIYKPNGKQVDKGVALSKNI